MVSPSGLSDPQLDVSCPLLASLCVSRIQWVDMPNMPLGAARCQLPNFRDHVLNGTESSSKSQWVMSRWTRKFQRASDHSGVRFQLSRTRCATTRSPAPRCASWHNHFSGKRKRFLHSASMRTRTPRFPFPCNLLETCALLTHGKLPRKRDRRRDPRCSAPRTSARVVMMQCP